MVTCAVVWCVTDGCEPPPYVENATAIFHQSARFVSLTCLDGHRFSDGQRYLTIQCYADASWPLIDHCQGQFRMRGHTFNVFNN